MSEPRSHDGSHGAGEEFDRELNLRAIVLSGLFVLAATAVSMLIGWWIFRGLERVEAKRNPAPPAMAEAAEPVTPPEPRLELSPPASLEAVHAREDEILHQPAWIDRAQGAVRLPIDLALDVVARRGLPAETGAVTAPPAAAPTAPGAPAAAPAPPGGTP